jgi:hypothetical protein
MSVAYTGPFAPLNKDVISKLILEQGLTEDLAVRSAPIKGQVVLYARDGASSWPYEHTIDDEQVEFNIGDFLKQVAAVGQDIEVHENGERETIAI